MRRFFSHSKVLLQATAKELEITDKLKRAFSPSRLQVSDISNGCGSMFQIEIASSSFKDKRIVEQHRMVQECLAKDIAEMHGIDIKTSTT